MRTKLEIRDTMIASKASNAVLGTWSNTSAVAIWLLFINIVAEAIFILENIFEYHKADVNETIAAMKPHSLRWYAEVGKQFQYGYNLPTDTDKYNNTGIPQATIDDSKIIAYIAVVEQEKGLRIKVATLDGAGNLIPLSPVQLLAFVAYMQRVKDAGVKLKITSTVADNLKTNLRVKYNPLVLTATGARLDGASASPVLDALLKHLQNLPFNGVFSIAKMIDAIQAVEGVTDVAVDLVQSQYGALVFTNINIDVVPDSGYLVLTLPNLTIAYISA